MDDKPINRFQRRKQRTRQQLKQAASELVVEKGYAAVTIDDIVERADVGRGTFYLHFKDKEQLVWRVIQEDIDALHMELNQKYRKVDLANLPFYGYLAMFEHAQRNHALYRALMDTGGDTILTRSLAEYVAAEIVREINSEGAYPDLQHLPPEFIAEFLTGAFSRLMEWWFRVSDPCPAIEMAAMFFEMVHHRAAPHWRQ